MAEDYAKKSCKKFQIKKMFIYGTTQEWNEDDACDSEVATVCYNEKGEVADYSDVSFPIEIVDENANFGHMHVNPMDVEYAEFEEGDERASL